MGNFRGTMAGITKVAAPCLNCADRHTLCHTDCAEYRNYLKEHEKVKSAVEQYKEQNRLYDDYKRKQFGQHDF